jgi:hypothetical protein
VLAVTRKDARKAGIPFTPATAAALDAYLADSRYALVRAIDGWCLPAAN